MESVTLTQDMFVPRYKRFFNVVIDFCAVIILAVLFMVFILILSALGFSGLGEWMANFTDGDYNVLWLAFMMAYYMVMEITMQRTLGKFITGTIVVSENGIKPAVKSIIGRSLCRIFWIEAFSFLGTYPRGWHDSASNTYVVDIKKYKQALNVQNSFDQIGIEIEQA
ncbi:RDD family protein [Flavobacterium hauense]